MTVCAQLARRICILPFGKLPFQPRLSTVQRRFEYQLIHNQLIWSDCNAVYLPFVWFPPMWQNIWRRDFANLSDQLKAVLVRLSYRFPLGFNSPAPDGFVSLSLSSSLWVIFLFTHRRKWVVCIKWLVINEHLAMWRPFCLPFSCVLKVVGYLNMLIFLNSLWVGFI